MAIVPKIDKNQQKADRLIEQLWPDASSDEFWNRKRRDGYATTPRALPLIMSIINDLTKGKPAGYAFFGLWSRSLNECVVEVKDPNAMAFEIGFVGERRVTAWQDRLELLEKLGFIKTASGATGKYSFVLLLNPYKVIYRLRQKKQIQTSAYNALFARAQEIGADDLEEENQRAKRVNARAASGKQK